LVIFICYFLIFKNNLILVKTQFSLDNIYFLLLNKKFIILIVAFQNPITYLLIFFKKCFLKKKSVLIDV